MDIKNKLFHGVRQNTDMFEEDIGFIKYSFSNLEKILKSGMIYTREESLKYVKKDKDILDSEYFQCINEVCLAIHPENSLFDKQVLSNNIHFNIDSYDCYIRHNFSLILNEKLLIDRSYKIEGMLGEVRIKNSISLQGYLVAIGYFDLIDNMIFTLRSIKNGEDYRKSNYRIQLLFNELLRVDNIKKYVFQKKQIYNQLKECLQKYKFYVPIVDPYSGNFINGDINKTINEIVEVKEKIKIISKKM